MKNYIVHYLVLAMAGWVGGMQALAGQTATGNATATAAAVTATGQATAATPAATGLPAIRSRLDPQPTPGSIPLPGAGSVLLSGYGQQAQEGLILAYFAAGTLGDGLSAGSLSGADARRQADSYLALATSARDDLRRVRAAYALEADELDQLDKLAAAYGDVIPMIEADQKLADEPTDPAARAACQAARRKAFATLSALFNWQ